jgi:hypothetical protein
MTPLLLEHWMSHTAATVVRAAFAFATLFIVVPLTGDPSIAAALPRIFALSRLVRCYFVENSIAMDYVRLPMQVPIRFPAEDNDDFAMLLGGVVTSTIILLTFGIWNQVSWRHGASCCCYSTQWGCDLCCCAACTIEESFSSDDEAEEAARQRGIQMSAILATPLSPVTLHSPRRSAKEKREVEQAKERRVLKQYLGFASAVPMAFLLPSIVEAATLVANHGTHVSTVAVAVGCAMAVCALFVVDSVVVSRAHEWCSFTVRGGEQDLKPRSPYSLQPAEVPTTETCKLLNRWPSRLPLVEAFGCRFGAAKLHGATWWHRNYYCEEVFFSSVTCVLAGIRPPYNVFDARDNHCELFSVIATVAAVCHFLFIAIVRPHGNATHNFLSALLAALHISSTSSSIAFAVGDGVTASTDVATAAELLSLCLLPLYPMLAAVEACWVARSGAEQLRNNVLEEKRARRRRADREAAATLREASRPTSPRLLLSALPPKHRTASVQSEATLMLPVVDRSQVRRDPYSPPADNSGHARPLIDV